MRFVIFLMILALVFVVGIASAATEANTAPVISPQEDITYYAYVPHLSSDICPNVRDTFDDPGTGWFTGRRDSLVAEYLDGEYRVMVTQPGTVWLFVAPGCARAQYRAAIDARWSGAPGNFYALLFNIQNGMDGSYLFAVNTDQRVWLVMQMRGSELRTIIPENGNDAILPGGQTNRLAAERRGEIIYLSVNGTPVGELRTGQPGKPVVAGVVVSSYTTSAPADARFDNFAYEHILAGQQATLAGAISDPIEHVAGPFHLTDWPIPTQ